ncbi:MAG: hypothetical protein HYV09_17115 [Deltaproteobacteria bacterium]|nr:hypothetical protein [Deltaproteobacteria bacterium]
MSALRLIIPLALLSLAACGGASKAPATGGAAPPPSAPPVYEDKAKAEPALLPVETRAASAQAELDEAQGAFSAAGGDCAALCKALASMSRATNSLCELVKEGGDPKRCSDAKARLESAQSKVNSSCGACG